MGRPVLYRQVRAGLNGKPFRLWKFRTMLDVRDCQGRLLPDSQRITRLGSLLRRFSIDELPQLVNVVRGDMSLVGPRPLLMRYLPRYTDRQRLRLTVKPGITGWAQINGRNGIDWPARFDLDVWYVERWTFWLDVAILAATVWRVSRAEGVLPGGGGDFEEFWGAESPPECGSRAFPVEADEFE
jgi:sugar transferase EpsL